MTEKKILHVGCGGDPLPEWAGAYTETRLDIDERHNPDILASMVDMGDIGKFDAILCVHALEHLYAHDVTKAMKEFHRVLNDGGNAIVMVPDMEDIKATEDVLYISPAGKITGLDVMYGMRSLLENQPHMAHKTGFVKDTLTKAFQEAGFSKIIVNRLLNYNLMGVGIK